MARALKLLLAAWLIVFSIGLPAEALTPAVEILLFGGAKPVSCASVPGLLADFDASVAASITQAAGSISQWSSIAPGVSNYATQSTGSKQPTVVSGANGYNAVRFVGANTQNLVLATTLSIDSAYTIIAVARNGAPSGTPMIAMLGDYPSSAIGMFVYGASITLANSIIAATWTWPGPPTTFQRIAMYASGSTIGALVAGVSLSLSGSGSAIRPANFTTIGQANGGYWMNADVAKICIYNAVLSVAQLKYVGGWMAKKWGVP